MTDHQATIIPTLRRRDGDASVDWSCRAFGFETRAAFRGEEGKFIHAQLTLPATEGHGMIMVSPVREGHDFDRFQGPERATMSAYVVVTDADAHHDRAVSAGARVDLPLADQHGGRLYSCLDFDGHLWNLRTCDSWASPAVKQPWHRGFRSYPLYW